MNSNANTSATDSSSERHVIFGTGPVGLSIMDALIGKGRHNIVLVNRSGRRPADAPDTVEVVAGDATNPASTTAICAGATHVYNATNAADYNKWPEQFPPLQAGVLAGAEAAGARYIAMENIYMYGSTGGAPITEDMPFNAKGARGVTRIRMAEQLMEAHDAGRVRVVTGRSSDFFGPRVGESNGGERLFEAALAGKKAQVMAGASELHTLNYMPDIGRGLVTLALDDEAYGRAWHLPVSKPITFEQFIGKVYALAGNEPGMSVLPGWMIPVIGMVVPPIRGLQELNYQMTEPFVLDDSQFRARYGDMATPLDQALETTMAWYRQHAKQAVH